MKFRIGVSGKFPAARLPVCASARAPATLYNDIGKIMKHTAIAACFAWGIALWLWSGACAAAEEKVRIGFFPMSGFHHYDPAGRPAGYGVDYLEKIREYTRWKYEYVRVDSWDEALERLRRGEVDLVGSAQWNPRRAELYDYSVYATGMTHAALIALTGNKGMLYEAFDDFHGARVGFVRTYVRLKEFLAYAQRHGFAPRMIPYENTAEMRRALHAGELDAMLASVMERDRDEKVVAECAPAPHYYITTKGNTALLGELDEALARIKIDDPGFENTLLETWYPRSAVPALSRKERAWIREHPVVSIGLLPRRGPLSGQEDGGTFTGIIPELLELLEHKTGLSFRFEPLPAGVSPGSALRLGQVQAVAGMVHFREHLEDPDLRLTRPFLLSHMILVGRQGEIFESARPLKVAVTTGFRAGTAFLERRYPNFKALEYPDVQACLDAVRDGEADLVLQNVCILARLLHGPQYAALTLIPTTSCEENFCITLRGDVDPPLLSILNKGIRSLSRRDVDQIIINHTVGQPYRISLIDFLKGYRKTIIAVGALSALCLILGLFAAFQRRKNMALLREHAATLNNITNNISGGVIMLIADKGFTITYANDGFLYLVGYTREEYEYKRVQKCVTYVHSEDIPLLNEAVRGSMESGKSLVMELRILHKNGTFIPVMFRGTLARGKEGETLLYCVVVDITDQRRMIESLEIEKERYRIVIEQSNDIIFEVDMRRRHLLCSPKFREKFGWQPAPGDLADYSAEKLRIHPDDAGHLYKMLLKIMKTGDDFTERLRIRRADGGYLWCRVLLTAIRKDGLILRLVGKIEDVDAQVREHDRLKTLSLKDPLSGLYNKTALRGAVESALERAADDEESAFLFVDIDNFKAVNDVLGHQKGDAVIQDVARLLQVTFRADDIVGRFGGDEFCVFARNLPEPLLREKIEVVNARLRRIYTGEDGRKVRISASVGVARSPRDGRDYLTLISKADKAVYCAKEMGKDRCVVFQENLAAGCSGAEGGDA